MVLFFFFIYILDYSIAVIQMSGYLSYSLKVTFKWQFNMYSIRVNRVICIRNLQRKIDPSTTRCTSYAHGYFLILFSKDVHLEKLKWRNFLWKNSTHDETVSNTYGVFNQMIRLQRIYCFFGGFLWTSEVVFTSLYLYTYVYFFVNLAIRFVSS